MAYPIKLFSSTDTGAPVLSGTTSALIALLDACLISGYNVKGIDSLTWTNGLATATCNSGHGYAVGDIIQIEGASNSLFNSQWQVKSVTTSNFTFNVPGSEIASPVGGTKTVRKAPAGWVKSYAGTSTAAYISSDSSSGKLPLRVDDSDPCFTRVRGYESLSDIDNGTGPWPTLTQSSTGLTWLKSDSEDVSSREWTLIADDRFFYLAVRAFSTQGCSLVWFGDINAFNATDSYSVMIKGHPSPSPSSAADGNILYVNGDQTGKYLSRGYHSVGSAVSCGLIGNILQTVAGYSGGFPFPNPVGAGLLNQSLIVSENNAARGLLPGMYQVLHNQPLSHNDQLPLVVNKETRNRILIDFAVDLVNRGRVIIDLTGPWR